MGLVVCRTSLFLMALEAVESVQDTDEFDAVLARVWRHGLCEDDELWENLLDEYSSGVNEQKLELLMRQTLLFAATTQYLSSVRRKRATSSASMSLGSAALTIELIDDLIENEEHEHSVINVRSRQLFAKTLNFALTH